MSLLDSLGDLLKQVSTGNAPASEVDAAYDQVARAVPNATLADGLSHAFKSDETPPFEQIVSGLFDKSTPEQKAGFFNHLLGVLGPAGVAQALGSAGIRGGPQALESRGNLTPQEAESLSPEAMQALAQQAAVKDPSIIDRAASFYAQHPTLVKSIGVGALALLMRRISASRT
ncbi:MAG TPA: hypothetical protein VF139_01440 [Candidatus Polarisedimenticolaceae bacterium]